MTWFSIRFTFLPPTRRLVFDEIFDRPKSLRHGLTPDPQLPVDSSQTHFPDDRCPLSLGFREI